MNRWHPFDGFRFPTAVQNHSPVDLAVVSWVVRPVPGSGALGRKICARNGELGHSFLWATPTSVNRSIVYWPAVRPKTVACRVLSTPNVSLIGASVAFQALARVSSGDF